MKKTVFAIAVFCLIFSGMSFAGGGGGVDINNSQEITALLLEQTTSAGISLNGPENYWTTVSVENGLASLHYDSGTVEPGIYIMRFNGFNQDGYVTVSGATEVSLGAGDEINVIIDLMPPSSIPVKIYLANAGERAMIEGKTTSGGWGSGGEIKQDSYGSYFNAWLPLYSEGTALITSGVNQYSLDISAASLKSYLGRGYASVTTYDQKSRINGLEARIFTGKVYPTDFPGMNLSQAAASVPENTTIKLIGAWFDEKVVLPAKNITIQGDPNFSSSINSDGEATIDIVPGNGGWVTLQYLQIQNYNYQSNGAAIRKLDDTNLYVSNVLVRTGNHGNAAIRGNAAGLWLNNLTLLGNNTGAAFDLSGPNTGSVNKSFILGYGRLFANVNAILPGNGNLVWQVGETTGLDYWQNSAVKDPKLRYEMDPYPDLNSLLYLPDRSYIGAVVPVKSY
ncbi:MAG: hypothetical protein Q8O93_01605 [bacterium]|nr:hypothetical protein [bacterium]